MKLDTLGVQAFLAIAEHGGFQKAADALGLSQAALSRRLQNLEAGLGVRLVERTTRSMALTVIGRDFLPQAQRHLTDLTAALAEIRETGRAQRGDVTIACIPTAGIQYLPAIIRAYAARHPNNRIKVLDHASSGAADAVLRREAEFGINVAGALHPDLVTVPLLDDRFVLICRDDHPLAGHGALPWRSIEPHPLIFAGQSSANRAMLDGAVTEHGLGLRAFYEVQRSSTAVGMVAEGVAAAIVPRLALQSGSYPRVRVVELVEPVVSRTVVLVSRTGAQLSPAAQALYDLIRSRRS